MAYTRTTASLLDIGDETRTGSYDLSSSEILRLKLTFTGGTGATGDVASVQIYNPSRAFYAWDTETTSFDSSTGIPTGESISSATAGETSKTFYLYNVSPDAEYYIWVRAQELKSLDFTIKVTGISTDWQVRLKENLGNISTNMYDIDIVYNEAATVARYEMTFVKAGTVTFYAEGSGNVYGYLSESTNFNVSQGKPSTVIASDTGSGRFSFTYEVERSTTYYLFTRMSDKTTIPDYTVNIKIGADLWSHTTTTIGTITEDYAGTYSNSAGWVRRFSVNFETSGTAVFYVDSNEDTVGYLSTSSTFDDEEGGPSSSLEESDDYGDDGDFRITYSVTAGKTYYLWVRHYEYTEPLSSYTLHINPPAEVTEWTVSSQNLGEDLEYYSTENIQIAAGVVKRYQMTFLYSGTASFNAGSYDAYGYLSTNTNFNNSTGFPTSTLVDDATAGSFTYEVEAGTTYYYWVRGENIDSVLTCSIEIKGPPEPIEPGSPFGIYVYNEYTKTWKKATPYVYKDGWKMIEAKLFINNTWT